MKEMVPEERENRAGEKELREDVEIWLADWFIGRAKISELAKQTIFDIDYFEAGWLTSLEVVEFVTEIEQQFCVQFSDHDLQDPRFVTIGGLAKLIAERRRQMSESAR